MDKARQLEQLGRLADAAFEQQAEVLGRLLRKEVQLRDRSASVRTQFAANDLFADLATSERSRENWQNARLIEINGQRALLKAEIEVAMRDLRYAFGRKTAVSELRKKL